MDLEDLYPGSVLYEWASKNKGFLTLSFVSTGSSILQGGFTPVFVDIERKTLNIDVSKIARYKGREVETLGDMAAFSLYVAHIITTIEGGIITTDNADFAEILRSLRAHGRACKCNECVLNVSSGYCPKRFKDKNLGDIRFVFERIGYSCKMNEIEAAIGLGNLYLYEEILKKRRDNLLYAMEEFKKFKDYFFSIEEEPYERIGPYAFPIIIKERVNFTRDEFVDYLEKRGVDTRNLFSSIPTQCKGFAFLGYKLGDFPQAEYIGNNGIHIGVHQDIGKKEIDYLIDLTDKFLREHG